MAWQTPKTNWGQPGQTVPGATDFNRIEGNTQYLKDEIDSHLADKVAHIDYAVASGTNTYTANIQGITALVEGLSVKLKFQNANTGASTLNINGLGAKEIRKSNGNALSAGNIKAGQICHLVYTGTVFQLLGEGGEYGTAQPEHVLEGYTIGTEEGIKSGTMPNNGAINQTLTTQGGSYTIPAGYHDGSGKVTAMFPNLIASNIKRGVNVGGIVGTAKIAIVGTTPESPLVSDNATYSWEINVTALTNVDITVAEAYRSTGVADTDRLKYPVITKYKASTKKLTITVKNLSGSPTEGITVDYVIAGS